MSQQALAVQLRLKYEHGLIHLMATFTDDPDNINVNKETDPPRKNPILRTVMTVK